MKKFNISGQALIESLIVLPVMIAAIGALLSGLFIFFSHSLIEHWVYESVLCVVKMEEEKICMQTLNSRIQLLPFINHTKLQNHSSRGEIAFSIYFENLLGQANEIHRTLPRNLNSGDFKGRQ